MSHQLELAFIAAALAIDDEGDFVCAGDDVAYNGEAAELETPKSEAALKCYYEAELQILQEKLKVQRVCQSARSKDPQSRS